MTYPNAPQQPGSYYALVPPPPPGTITAARIIGWIQGGLAAVATAILVIITIVASDAVGRANSDTDGAFSDVGNAAIGVLVALVVVLGALTAAIIIPLTRLKPGHTSAGTGLVVVEGVFIVLDLASLSDSGSKVVPVIAMCLSITMIVLLCSQSARLWLKTGQSAVTAFNGASPRASVDSTQWSVDPYGRHELRLYDGTQWTDWVSDNAIVTTDRLDTAVDYSPLDSTRQWASDPYGRHELRLYDGRWTDWVSDNAMVRSDPIA